MFKAIRMLRARERISEPKAFLEQRDNPTSKSREYLSKRKLLGIPLLHFQFGMHEQKDNPVLAWFAGGSHAHQHP